jgi:hypothetical protein
VHDSFTRKVTMENSSSLFVEGARPSAGVETVWPSLEDWSTARAVHIDLLLMRRPRTNLLLMGKEGIVQSVLDMLLPNLYTPLDYWHPGERLMLPPASQSGTLILRDVGWLTPHDQFRLLEWLELTAGRTQVISTIPSPLLPRLQAGEFLDTLYYRLNTVCMDVTS